MIRKIHLPGYPHYPLSSRCGQAMMRQSMDLGSKERRKKEESYTDRRKRKKKSREYTIPAG